jgi:hypothetical protein
LRLKKPKVEISKSEFKTVGSHGGQMVADIRLLQGKIVEDPELRSKSVSKLIHELALEILSEEELAAAASKDSNAGSSK